ncbi:hypothetical protein [Streptomyces sp. NPDC056387]|uniref:hypothetical protein n=1 Tax=Streptomyces sp. NPDC056387 TaxID=3345803 RepID=UPI0035E00B1B
MTLAVVLFTTALVFVVALLAGTAAGKLARLDGATYPTALTRAATTFATVITLATVITTTLETLSAEPNPPRSPSACPFGPFGRLIGYVRPISDH